MALGSIGCEGDSPIFAETKIRKVPSGSAWVTGLLVNNSAIFQF
jgi:hypothetical protein